MIAGLVSVAIAHVIYAFLKPWLARLRPCDVDPMLPLCEKPLDKYSCPSGHCMTVTAVGVPLGWSYPSMVPAVVFCVILISWARLSLGHHYLSDILLGILVAVGISWPVSAALL